jgi:hypothetical protein
VNAERHACGGAFEDGEITAGVDSEWWHWLRCVDCDELTPRKVSTEQMLAIERRAIDRLTRELGEQLARSGGVLL